MEAAIAVHQKKRMQGEMNVCYGENYKISCRGTYNVHDALMFLGLSFHNYKLINVNEIGLI